MFRLSSSSDWRTRAAPAVEMPAEDVTALSDDGREPPKKVPQKEEPEKPKPKAKPKLTPSSKKRVAEPKAKTLPKKKPKVDKKDTPEDKTTEMEEDEETVPTKTPEETETASVPKKKPACKLPALKKPAAAPTYIYKYMYKDGKRGLKVKGKEQFTVGPLHCVNVEIMDVAINYSAMFAFQSIKKMIF